MQCPDIMDSMNVDILLLDCRIITIPYKNYYFKDLIDVVLPLLGVCESTNKEAFGFVYLDICERMCWLHTDKRLLDHSIPKLENGIKLALRIRFHSSLMSHKNPFHILQVFLDARRCFLLGNIPSSGDQLLELLSLNLLVEFGPYLSKETLSASLKPGGRVPSWAMRVASSSDWIDLVHQRFIKVRHLSPGEAISRFLEIIMSLPLYGVHVWQVMKEDVTQLLGVAPMGIVVYASDTHPPQEINMYPWRSVCNVYGRSNRFSIEVYTSTSTQLSKIRSSSGVIEVNVVGWHLDSEQSTRILLDEVKSHWTHYRDLENQGATQKNATHSDFVYELNQLFETGGLFNMCVPLQLQNTTDVDLVDADLVSYIPLDVINNRNAEFERPNHFSRMQDEKYSLDVSPYPPLARQLYNRYSFLKNVLQTKEEEYRKLCLQEAAITEVLPSNYKRQPQDRTLTSGRCIKTEYNLSTLVNKRCGSVQSLPAVGRANSSINEELADMELQLEVQSQILHAHKKLSKDPSLPKACQKQYGNAAVQSSEKLSTIKHRMRELRQQSHDGRASPSFLQVPDDRRRLASIPVSGSTVSMFDFSLSSSKSTEDVSRLSSFRVTPAGSNNPLLETTSVQNVPFATRVGSHISTNSAPTHKSRPIVSTKPPRPPLWIPPREQFLAPKTRPQSSYLQNHESHSWHHRQSGPPLSRQAIVDMPRGLLQLPNVTHSNTDVTADTNIEEDWRLTVEVAKHMKNRRSFFYPESGLQNETASASTSPYLIPESAQNSPLPVNKRDSSCLHPLKAARSSEALTFIGEKANGNSHLHLAVHDTTRLSISPRGAYPVANCNEVSSDEYWEASL